MERKTKVLLELVVVIPVLVSIVILTLRVYSAETDSNVRLLAIGIILSAFLGGYNMFKSLFRSGTAKEFEKANKLKEQEIETLKEQLDIEKERRGEEIEAKKKEEEAKKGSLRGKI